MPAFKLLLFHLDQMNYTHSIQYIKSHQCLYTGHKPQIIWSLCIFIRFKDYVIKIPDFNKVFSLTNK